MFLRLAAFVSVANIVRSKTCDDLCNEVSDCANDMHGSYCKESNECFGLYWTDDSNSLMCFASGNSDCNVCSSKSFFSNFFRPNSQ